MCVCGCCCFVLLQTKIHFVALVGLEFTKIRAPVPQGDIFKINHREDLLRNTCCQGWGDGLVGGTDRRTELGCPTPTLNSQMEVYCGGAHP